MSATILSSCGFKTDSFDKHDSLNLEKCGEVFLEKQLGNLIYVCTLCDDKFKDIDAFLKHISDVHISVDHYISFDPNESDEETVDKYEQLEETNGDVIEDVKDSEAVEDEYPCASEDSILNNEAMFNEIDSSNTVLDIQVYDDTTQLEQDIKVEEEDDSQQSADLKEILMKNPIEIEEESLVDVSEFGCDVVADDYPQAADAATELDAADASDKEILRSKIRCKYCGDQFDYVKDLRKHDCGLKKGKKVHHCTECGKVFKKKSGLDIHVMVHNGEKPHKCKICGTAYACKQNLIVHVRRHTGEKPFKCNFCDRRFASSTEKISHMRTHTGERPFVCDMCGKAHTSSSQLTEHMHRHLDIRNYACEICEKRFRNSYNLRMHRMTHDDAPRKFVCEHCLSAFKTQSNLMQHIKIHQKEKKYVCKICGRAFAQHPGLYSHMKSHAVFK